TRSAAYHDWNGLDHNRVSSRLLLLQEGELDRSIKRERRTGKLRGKMLQVIRAVGRSRFREIPNPSPSDQRSPGSRVSRFTHLVSYLTSGLPAPSGRSWHGQS